MRVLLGGFVVSGVVGCLPVSDFGDGSSTTTGVGVTSSGGVTGSGPGSTSSGSSGGTMSSSAEPTWCSILCGITEDMPLDGCDLFAPECPEGQKCMPIITDGAGSWDSTRCVPVLGRDAPGEPCTAKSLAEGLDSCVEGAICWGVDMNGNGNCVAQCKGTEDAPVCPSHSDCTISSSGVLNLCLPWCDPLLQDCGEGVGCYAIYDDFSCAPDASGDTGKANDPCEDFNACEVGLLCGDPAFVGAGCPQGSMGCCTQFCEFPEGACPNPDQECVQWFDPAMLPEGDSWLAIGACGVAS